MDTGRLERIKTSYFYCSCKKQDRILAKSKESASKERLLEDKLMLEAEEDIKAGRTYSIDEAHEIKNSWEM